MNQDYLQAAIDPPDAGRLECRNCGGRTDELRECCECGVVQCAECMLRHLTQEHGDFVVKELSDSVSMDSLASAESDRRCHERQGV